MSMNTELMPFKKFVQAKLNKLYHDDTVRINGVFMEIPSKKIIKGDIFDAHLVGKSLEETYKAYIDWFNHTRTQHEAERRFVSVEKVAENEENGNK